MKINVLFTSVGRRVELINKWKETYHKLKLRGKIIGTDIDRLAPAVFSVDKHYIVKPTKSPNFIKSIIDICNEEKINLVFPLIDNDIPVLNKYKKQIEITGAKLISIKSDKVKISQDKWNTFKFFKSLNLHTPKSFLPNKIDNEITFPLFGKPRMGSGSIGVKKINNIDELKYYINHIDNPIIQEFISGTEITCDIVSNLKQQVLGVILRERIEVRNGEVSKGRTIRNNKITKACEKIANVLGSNGPITVQCILNKNKPYFIEINARYGGGAPLGIAAGANSPEWLLKDVAGIDYNKPSNDDFIDNLYMSRSDNSMFITEKELNEI